MSASDAEISDAANEVFAIIRSFDSPRDAASALTLAYYMTIKAAFPPGQRDKAFEAIDADAELVKDLMKMESQ